MLPFTRHHDLFLNSGISATGQVGQVTNAKQLYLKPVTIGNLGYQEKRAKYSKYHTDRQH
jgi:hypothetical protein